MIFLHDLDKCLEDPQKKFQPSTTFMCRFSAKICTVICSFVKKWSCFSRFCFLEIEQKVKLTENKEVSHFRLFLAPGIDFLGKNTSEMVYFKNLERIIFRPFFDKTAYHTIFSPKISHKSTLESGRKLNFFWGSFKHLSKSCKKIKFLFASGHVHKKL